MNESSPRFAARCRAANRWHNWAAREARGRIFTGVQAPANESDPHGIGVESLTARHSRDLA
jgi:hypothetical protein